MGAQARAQAPDDPYEQMNRRFYQSQSEVDRKYLQPLARLYQRLTPGPIGQAIHNMLTELSEPVVFFNDVLQGRLRWAGKDLTRLVANGSFGLGGTIDVAAKHGLPHHDNDFGITMGVWGVRPGPYLFLPFLGPTTVRDAIGMGADAGMNPLNFVRFGGWRTLQISSAVVGGIDKRAHAQADLDAITAGAADPYATLRSVYLQSREAEVRGEDATPILPPIDPSPADAGPSAAVDGLPRSVIFAASADPTRAIAASAAAQPAAASVVADLDAPIATAQPADLDPTAMRFAAN